MKKPAMIITLILSQAVAVLAVDSLNVNLIGRLNLCWSTTGDICLQDGLAYLATGYSGLRILDVSDAEQPVEIGWCDTWGSATSVGVANGYAYVTTYWGGFRTYDVSDPAHPVETDVQDLEYMLSDIVLTEGYAWVAGRWEGLYIFDLSDPAHPLQIGSCNNPGSDTFDLAVCDTLAYLVDGYNGLSLVDAGDPDAPILLWTIDVPNTTWGVDAQPGWAYVASNELYAVTLADPYDPHVSGYWAPDCYATDVELHGGYAWVTCNSGLFIASIYNPGVPVEAGSFTDYPAHDIAFADDFAVLSTGNISGVRTLDVSDPAEVVELGGFARPLQAQTIAVNSNLAAIGLIGYIDPYTDRLRLVDISDSGQSWERGEVELHANLMRLAITEQYAFAACQNGGLLVIDISDPDAPFAAGGCDPEDTLYNLTLAGDYAFATVQGLGLRAIDISEPIDPFTCGELGIAAGTCDVAVSGELACVTTFGGFSVVDISDPEQMEMLGSTGDLPGLPGYVDVNGTLACLIWVEDGSGGVCVVDFADPLNPVPRGWCLTPGGDCASGLVVRDHYACVADQAGRVQIVDFSDPDDPFIAGSYPMPDRTKDVAWHSGGLIYAVDGNDLAVLDFTLLEHVAPQPAAPERYSLLSAYPNPFNAQVTLQVQLTAPGRVELRMWDLLGRQVDRLGMGTLPAGGTNLTWQPPAASGVYLVELSVNGVVRDQLRVTQVK